MIIVSDSTPLRYLAVIGGLDWLPALFGQVVCPPEVLAECLHEQQVGLRQPFILEQLTGFGRFTL